MKSILAVLVLCLLASFALSAKPIYFCENPSGGSCLSYDENRGSVATLEAVTEDEEVVLEYSEAESTTTLSAEIQKSPKTCKSFCGWINTKQYWCKSCSYAWVFYDSSVGYKGQCVTSDTVPTIQKENPQLLDYYSSLCDNRGSCTCGGSGYTGGGGRHKNALN